MERCAAKFSGVSFEKIEKRKEKYRKLGQYRNGMYYCRTGKPITWERISQYEGMIHHLLRKYFPAGYVAEASLIYEDLIAQGRLEIFLAILNGFDPFKAFTTREQNEEKREQTLQKKQDNPDETLSNAEKNIVYGRLINYFKRTAWKFHPNQLGGRTHSYDVMTQNAQEKKYRLFDELSCDSTESDQLEEILKTLETKGEEKAKKKFLRLPKKKREEILEICQNRAYKEQIEESY